MSVTRTRAGWSGVVRRSLTENLGLKIFSFLVALGLFYVVHGSEDAQRPVFVDVVALLPPVSSGKLLMSDLPDKVRVTLRGSRSMLNALKRDELGPLQVDLRDGSRRYYYFDPTAFDLPAGVEVVSIAPPSVQLMWARRAERRATVVPQIVGRPRAGLVMQGEPSVEPGSVLVSGPDHVVQRLATVETETIDLSAFGAGHHERTVALVPPIEHVSYQQAGPVRIAIDLSAEVNERRWRGLTVATVGTAARALLRPTTVDVRLRGSPSVLMDVDADHLVPFVDLTELDATHGATSVRVQLRGAPEGTEIAVVDPPEVLVTMPPRH